MRDASARLRPETSLLVVGALTLLGLALRIPSFGDSLFGDEVSTYGIVSGHGPGTILDLVRSDLENTPPLFYLLAAAGERLGGAPEGIRLPSMLAGVAAIPLTYWLGSLTVGRRATLVGAGLIAISPFLIFYSTEARSYSLAMLLGLLSTLALLRAVELRTAWWWVAYAALSCAAMYTHYTVGFVLLAQLLWAFVAHPPVRMPLLAANAAAAVAFFPWLPGLLEDSESPTYLYERLSPLDLNVALDQLGRFALGHPFIEEIDLHGRLGIVLAVLGLAIGLAGLAARLLRAPPAESRRPDPNVLLVVTLAGAVPVGAAVYSLIGESVFTPRNLIPSWPGFALAVGALLTAGRGWLAIAAPALCMAGVAIGTVRMTDADYRRPDYAAAVAYIDSATRAGSPIAEFTQFTFGPQTPLEAALGPPHEARPGGHPVLVVPTGAGQGWPPIATRHRYLHAEATILVWAPLTRGRTLAEQGARAGRLARGGTVFFVGSERVPSAFTLLPGAVPQEFVDALPPGYRLAETRSFPGFSPFSLRVYAFRAGASREARAPETEIRDRRGQR